MTLGMNALNAVGANLNSLPLDFKFLIGNTSYTFAEAMLKYDRGELSFREIMQSLLSASKSHETLHLLSDYIFSLHNFLYKAETGVSELFEK